MLVISEYLLRPHIEIDLSFEVAQFLITFVSSKPPSGASRISLRYWLITNTQSRMSKTDLEDPQKKKKKKKKGPHTSLRPYS